MSKYTKLEIERRWLVDSSLLPDLGELKCKKISDRYIEGTRMRLRAIKQNGDIAYKLCKKYGKERSITESIVNVYLTEEEFGVLLQLPAKVLNRHRYQFNHGENLMAINVGENGCPIIAECEFGNLDDARTFVPPHFCVQEVSDDQKFEAWRFATYEHAAEQGGSSEPLTRPAGL